MAWNKIIIVCLLLTAIIAMANCGPINGKLSDQFLVLFESESFVFSFLEDIK